LHKLVFTHVPKTAGSTFSASMRKHYEDGQFIVAIKGDRSLMEFLEQGGDASKLRYIGGHVSVEQVEGLLGVPRENQRPVATVRDPLDRAISHYFYLRRVPHAMPGFGERARELGFQDFCDAAREEMDFEFNNFRCRFLSGEASFAATWGLIEQSYFIVATPIQMERFVGSVCRMEGFSGSDKPEIISRLVAPRSDLSEEIASGSRPHSIEGIISPEQQRRFEQANAEDYQLYHRIRDVHDGFYQLDRYRQVVSTTSRQPD